MADPDQGQSITAQTWRLRARAAAEHASGDPDITIDAAVVTGELSAATREQIDALAAEGTDVFDDPDGDDLNLLREKNLID